MLSFSQFGESDVLSEAFQNLFFRDIDKRKKYAQEVYAILQESYKDIGGLKSSGFQTSDMMIKQIPFWKLGIRDGKVVACIMYKDKIGRKSVAMGTDGSAKGKTLVTEMLKADFGRSIGEKSSKVLRFIKKRMPEMVKKYAFTALEAKEILKLDDSNWRAVKGDKFEYEHKFSTGEWIPKMLLGTPGKKVIQPEADS